MSHNLISNTASSDAAPVRDRAEPQKAPPVHGDGSAGAPSKRVRRPRLAALDGFRFAAAMMMVLYHYAGYAGGVSGGAWAGRRTTDLFGGFSDVAAYGWTGVELFFLISGFVICMSTWGRGLGDFFRSRVVRLYPAYWVAVLATAAVLTLWPQVRQGPSYSDMLMNLTMLHEPMGVKSVDGVYWTLWAELRFYLLFGLLVVWRGVTYRRTVLFCVLWLAAVAVSTQMGGGMLSVAVQPRYAAFFIGGVAFYLIHRFGPDPLLWGIVGMSWLFAQHAIAVEAPRQVDGNHPHLSVSVCIALVTFFYLIMAILALGLLDRVTWNGLTVMGALTYPLYLIHEDIGWTLIYDGSGHMNAWALLAAVTAGAIAAAYILNRCVERPLVPVLSQGLSTGLSRIRNPVERVRGGS
ncbi:acyltransferase [Yinghuangia aomiensis]|uniref:Acyltransferase n=1 Tax=Yinghuangia aomiensis TaxID=676205 RepID=A0ABP9ICY2_9ACTN